MFIKQNDNLYYRISSNNIPVLIDDGIRNNPFFDGFDFHDALNLLLNRGLVTIEYGHIWLHFNNGPEHIALLQVN